jgi:hypothetical protein
MKKNYWQASVLPGIYNHVMPVAVPSVTSLFNMCRKIFVFTCLVIAGHFFVAMYDAVHSEIKKDEEIEDKAFFGAMALSCGSFLLSLIIYTVGGKKLNSDAKVSIPLVRLCWFSHP